MTETPHGAGGGRKRNEHAHEAILEATLATLREVGYQQLTMEGVAARAGVAKATIYRWWPQKSHLIIEAVGTQLTTPLQTQGNSEADIRAVIQRTIEFVGGVLGDVYAADIAHDPTAGPQLEDLLGPYRAAHTAILLAAAARGDLPYTIDATAVLDVINGAVLFRKLMKRPLDDHFTDQLTALITSGQIPRTLTA
jgi:AcrR family transcriptional regulator